MENISRVAGLLQRLFGLIHGSPALEPFEVVAFKDHCGASQCFPTNLSFFGKSDLDGPDSALH